MARPVSEKFHVPAVADPYIIGGLREQQAMLVEIQGNGTVLQLMFRVERYLFTFKK